MFSICDKDSQKKAKEERNKEKVRIIRSYRFLIGSSDNCGKSGGSCTMSSVSCSILPDKTTIIDTAIILIVSYFQRQVVF
jgi:hypothetical protein